MPPTKLDKGMELIQKGLRLVEQGSDPQSDKPFSVMYYGWSNNGVADAAIRSSALRHREFHRPLRIIVAQNDIASDKRNRKSKSELDEKRAELELKLRQYKTMAPHFEFISIWTSEADAYMRNLDMFTLTAHCAPGHVNDRMEMTEYNRDLVARIAQLRRLSPDTHFSYVTSSGEVLAHAVQLITGGDPHKQSAHSHIDKKRLDNIVITFLKTFGYNVQGTDAFCVGYHHWTYPVINNVGMDFGDGRGFVTFSGTIDESVRMAFEELVREHPYELRELAQRAKTKEPATGSETGDAITDEKLAHIKGNRMINAAVYLDGIYQSAPTKPKNGRALPNKSLMERLDAIDTARKQERESHQEQWLAHFGLQRMNHPTEWEYDENAGLILPQQRYVPAVSQISTQERSAQRLQKANAPQPKVEIYSPRKTPPAPRRYAPVEQQPTQHQGPPTPFPWKPVGIAALVLALAGGAYKACTGTVEWYHETTGTVEYWQKRDPVFLRQVFKGKEEVDFAEGRLSLTNYLQRTVKEVHYSPSNEKGAFNYQGAVIVFNTEGNAHVHIIDRTNNLFGIEWVNDNIVKYTKRDERGGIFYMQVQCGADNSSRAISKVPVKISE